MGYEKYTGIVAREVDTGEADRYLTLLTVERGRLECYAKGIRRQKSKLAAQAGLQTYGEFQLYRKGERYILVSARAIESFYNIRTDIVKCAYATHFLEIARDVVVEEQAFPQALQTLLNTLYVLCYRNTAPDFVSRVFEIRILSLAGFAPMLDECSVCGARLPESGNGIFAVYGDGLICGAEDCRISAGRTLPVSAGAKKAIGYVINCGADGLFNFALNDSVMAELAAVVPEYLRCHFGKEYEKPAEAERYRAFEKEMLKMNRRKLNDE